MAALGDSITRGFDACKPLSNCPEVSWATGSRTGVSSLTRRLTAAAPATRSWNLAGTGARVADLQDQARAAAAHRPAMVTVLIGANDACTSRLQSTMTPVAGLPPATSAAAMAYPCTRRCRAAPKILVAPAYPDLERLWSSGPSPTCWA